METVRHYNNTIQHVIVHKTAIYSTVHSVLVVYLLPGANKQYFASLFLPCDYLCLFVSSININKNSETSRVPEYVSKPHIKAVRIRMNMPVVRLVIYMANKRR